MSGPAAPAPGQHAGLPPPRRLSAWSFGRRLPTCGGARRAPRAQPVCIESFEMRIGRHCVLSGRLHPQSLVEPCDWPRTRTYCFPDLTRSRPSSRPPAPASPPQPAFASTTPAIPLPLGSPQAVPCHDRWATSSVKKDFLRYPDGTLSLCRNTVRSRTIHSLT
jgi:hypothetical protein